MTDQALTQQTVDIEKLHSLTTYLSPEEWQDIERAFHYAYDAHQEQKRKSGEPYIDHCIATACELAKIRMDTPTVQAGLLHDVPEDTEKTLEDVENEFGRDVARLVNGVTKLGKVRLRSQEEQQAQNLRKMFLAMAEDVRVIIIKLCDRLHNMRTIDALPRHKQKGIARETLEIYAPLANRLGMSELRWKLEDLCFSCLDPKKYKEIQRTVAKHQGRRDEVLSKYLAGLEGLMEKNNIEGKMKGRAKHYYSIYRNVFLLNKEDSVDDLLDSIGVRVIVRTVSECYQMLGLIHREWRPIVGRFKDFIAIPKSNGYQSLHTGVITENGDRLEIQIRTEEMDFVAEYGMAAHWKYKDSVQFDRTVEERMQWIHQLLDWQKEFRSALDFVEALKLDLFKEQIFVFTPHGDVKDLPKGATPIDFAYSVHTDLGHSCIGAKVNGRMVPLSYKLENSEIIEILRSRKRQAPNRAWLEFVQTSRAKEKIRAWFKQQHREENKERGERILKKKLEKIYGIQLDNIPETKLIEVSKILNYNSIEDLFVSIGFGEIGAMQVSNRLVPDENNNISKNISVANNTSNKKKIPSTQLIRGVGDLLVKLAPCCSPLMGDTIQGYISRGRGIIVHRASCGNIRRDMKREPERVVDLKWKQHGEDSLELDLIITANDRRGLMSDITAVIASQDVGIDGIHYQSQHSQGTIRFPISVELAQIHQLSTLIRGLEQVAGVLSVVRK